MIQWVRICHAVQGTWFDSSLGTNILHATEQLSAPPTIESIHCNRRSHMMQTRYHVLQLKLNEAKYIIIGEKIKDLEKFKKSYVGVPYVK